MQIPPPDWQLPPGISRGVWEYIHDEDLAVRYETGLTGSSLTAMDVQFAERHFQRPGRLIDLGCGTGRLLVPFARRGHWVLGVDLSEAMLRLAAEKAAAAGVTIHRLKANLVELGGVADESFDHAACLFSTLGMVAGAVERQRVVSHVYRLLRPGGIFVLHVHNLWFSLRDRAGRRWLVRECLGLRGPGEEKGTRPMPAHQGLASLALHHFTRGEVVKLLESTGFQIVKVEPLGLGIGGRLACRWWFGGLRAYGFLVAARKG